MSNARAEMRPGQEPWYIGWSNCHPGVLQELRKLYEKPHFLPVDAEMPNTDFVFLGWEQGAVMHVSWSERILLLLIIKRVFLALPAGLHPAVDVAGPVTRTEALAARTDTRVRIAVQELWLLRRSRRRK